MRRRLHLGHSRPSTVRLWYISGFQTSVYTIIINNNNIIIIITTEINSLPLIWKTFILPQFFMATTE
jgi:hypothetical protein